MLERSSYACCSHLDYMERANCCLPTYISIFMRAYLRLGVQLDAFASLGRLRAWQNSAKSGESSAGCILEL
jgi:hypothetical protein